MEYPLCLTQPTAGSTFAGFGLSQSWNDLALWEAFLDAHPCCSVLELGTWRGGMSVFFALQGLAREMQVVSVDRDLGQAEGRATGEKLGCEYLSIDLHSEAGRLEVEALVARLPKPLMLFCDDGHKPGEWRAFVPMLSPGDFAAVHDWGREIHEFDLVPPLPMVSGEVCDEVSSWTRFFRVP